MSAVLKRTAAWMPAVAFGAALSVTGCAQNIGSPPIVAECQLPAGSGGERPGMALVGQPYGIAMTPLPLNSVQFGSVEVSRSLAVQSLHAARTPTSTVEVSARLLSCMNEPTSIRVRTSFVRADTAPAEPISAWKRVHLEPRAVALYSERSTSVDAAHYLIEIAR